MRVPDALDNLFFRLNVLFASPRHRVHADPFKGRINRHETICKSIWAI